MFVHISVYFQKTPVRVKNSLTNCLTWTNLFLVQNAFWGKLIIGDDFVEPVPEPDTNNLISVQYRIIASFLR